MSVWIVTEDNFGDMTIWGVTSTREKGMEVCQKIHAERQDRHRARKIRLQPDLNWVSDWDHSSANYFTVDKWEVQ